ncbi:MAG: nuclear transport factor 2 family protein [Acidimicrobiales bacterium]
MASADLAPPLALDPADRQTLVELSFSYAAGIDHRDWGLYRRIFTDSCEIDFSSWSGRAPATMSADDWVDAVRRVNGYFDATQHLMSNHRFDLVDPDTVVGTNEVQAQHWFGADSMSLFGRAAEPAWCLLGGHYTNRYERGPSGWRIAACRLTVRWRTGDETIFAFARQRGAQA